MDVKELANKYRSEIPSNLSDIEFLKAVYIKLAHEKAFDEKYYFGNSGTIKKIYKLAQKNKNSRVAGKEKRTIICCSLSYEIEHLLEELGYKCFVTPYFEIGDHVFPIVVLDDGTQIKYDLQKDLENIQTHCRTQFFATIDRDDFSYNLHVFDDDEQFKVDKAIGYVDSIEDYKDSDIENLDKKIAENPDATIWQKLNLILSDTRVNDISKDTGYIECYRYYTKRLLPRYFTTKEFTAKVHVITCSRQTSNNDSNNEIEFTNCIYVDDKSAPQAVYMFSRVHNKYILTPYENLIKLEEEGLIIGNKYPSNGSKKLKKELNIYKSEKDLSMNNLDDSNFQKC